MTRWFEDIPVGETFDMGNHTFTTEEIIAFGRDYDPQYFHVDPEAAKQSHFGGLIASGWHTIAMGHRKMVDTLMLEEERLRAEGMEPGISGPSPGVNHMNFRVPVRPGDTLTYRMRVREKRPSRSLPGWGVLVTMVSATNQNGQEVYNLETVGFSRLRDYKPSIKERLGLIAMQVPFLKGLIRR